MKTRIGFTLIELLIVMVIVGILVAVALPKYAVTLEKGRAQEAIAYLKNWADLLNSEYELKGKYPLGNALYNLPKPESPELKYFFIQQPERACSNSEDGGCTLSLERKGMYSITMSLKKGKLVRMYCTPMLQVSPTVMDSDGNAESYNKYCGAIARQKECNWYVIIGNGNLDDLSECPAE